MPFSETVTVWPSSTPVVVPEKNYTADVDAILKAVTPRTKMVFLANPNNPTGTFVEPAAMHGFLKQVPAEVLVVLDEVVVVPPLRARPPLASAAIASFWMTRTM